METKKIMIQENFTVEAASKFRESTSAQLSNELVNFQVDFANCKFIDSTGLGVLVSLLKRCTEKGCKIELRNLNEDVYKIFHMTRLDQVFDIK